LKIGKQRWEIGNWKTETGIGKPDDGKRRLEIGKLAI
jgi:hypothetical protein